MEQIPLRVMVVDDSAFMRRFLGDIIKEDKMLQLVGTSCDGEDVLRKIARFKPDVITLDVEMPKLNGVDALKKIMKENPLPVIMVSSHTKKGSEITLEALSAGAVDFVTKPSLSEGESISELKRLLPEKIKAAAGARLFRQGSSAERELKSSDLSLAGEQLIRRAPRFAVAIGTSTGGPRALEEIMRGLPDDLPAAVFVTQHMPAGFTLSLAERLNKVSSLKVKEATDGETVLQGYVYLAKGGYHLILEKNGTIALSSSAPVQHVRPSIDVMMDSLVDFFGADIIGVILTGMGRDGSQGMAKIKEKGGRTVVQEPSTAVIPSMPVSVIRAELADMVVPLPKIAFTITSMLR